MSSEHLSLRSLPLQPPAFAESKTVPFNPTSMKPFQKFERLEVGKTYAYPAEALSFGIQPSKVFLITYLGEKDIAMSNSVLSPGYAFQFPVYLNNKISDATLIVCRQDSFNSVYRSIMYTYEPLYELIRPFDPSSLPSLRDFEDSAVMFESSKISSYTAKYLSALEVIVPGLLLDALIPSYTAILKNRPAHTIAAASRQVDDLTWEELHKMALLTLSLHPEKKAELRDALNTVLGYNIRLINIFFSGGRRQRLSKPRAKHSRSKKSKSKSHRTKRSRSRK